MFCLPPPQFSCSFLVGTDQEIKWDRAGSVTMENRWHRNSGTGCVTASPRADRGCWEGGSNMDVVATRGCCCCWRWSGSTIFTQELLFEVLLLEELETTVAGLDINCCCPPPAPAADVLLMSAHGAEMVRPLPPPSWKFDGADSGVDSCCCG